MSMYSCRQVLIFCIINLQIQIFAKKVCDLAYSVKFCASLIEWKTALKVIPNDNENYLTQTGPASVQLSNDSPPADGITHVTTRRSELSQ